MLTLDQARETTRVAIDDIIARLAAASDDDWRRPTPCPAWTVADLAAHIAWVSAALGDALCALASGVPADRGAPAVAPAGDERALDGIRDGRRRLCAGFQAQTDESLQRICHVPFGDMPGFLALQLIACEFAIHAHDLARALGVDAALPAEAVAASNAILQAALPMMARAATIATPTGAAYQFRGEGVEIALSRTADGWITGGMVDNPDFTMTGSGSDLILFVFGRVPLDHGTLQVTGNQEAASQFKTRFPGP